MTPYMRDERELDTVATRGFARVFVIATLTAAAIGLCIGIAWVIAGLLSFHSLGALR
jgi:hypothetical protein